MSDGIPDNVRALIIERIGSVLELEILLLLHAQSTRQWTAPEIAAELRIDPNWAEGQLQDLCGKGLVHCEAGDPSIYMFAPRSKELRAAVDALVPVYAERRVTVVTLIFSKPVDKLKTFADAFRIRKEQSNE